MATRGRKPSVRTSAPEKEPAGVIALSKRVTAYYSITEACIARVNWLKVAPPEGADIVFRLCEPGRAIAFEAETNVGRLNPEFDSQDEQRARDMYLTVHRGAFVKPNNLRLPLPVVAHVTGDLKEEAAFWIWATASAFELWDEERRRHYTQIADRRIREEIALFPGFE